MLPFTHLHKKKTYFQGQKLVGRGVSVDIHLGASSYAPSDTRTRPTTPQNSSPWLVRVPRKTIHTNILNVFVLKRQRRKEPGLTTKSGHFCKDLREFCRAEVLVVCGSLPCLKAPRYEGDRCSSATCWVTNSGWKRLPMSFLSASELQT